MRNLNRMTWAAQRLEHGPSEVDLRSAPRCEEADCRRACARLPDGTYLLCCYRHMTGEVAVHFYALWQQTRSSWR